MLCLELNSAAWQQPINRPRPVKDIAEAEVTTPPFPMIISP